MQVINAKAKDRRLVTGKEHHGIIASFIHATGAITSQNNAIRVTGRAWCGASGVTNHDSQRHTTGDDKSEMLAAVAFITLPNPPSIRLHENLGFIRAGVMPGVGWKFDQSHDVGIWVKNPV